MGKTKPVKIPKIPKLIKGNERSERAYERAVIAKRIITQRLRIGISRMQLADLADIKVRTVVNTEKMVSTPGEYIQNKIAKAFKQAEKIKAREREIARKARKAKK